LNKTVVLESNSSIKHLNIPLNNYNKTASFVKASLVVEQKIIAKSNYFFKPFKELDLNKPEIKFKIKRNKRDYILILETDLLALDVFLSLEKEHFFSDNYFDLIPGEKQQVILKIDKEIEEKYLYKNLKIITLADTY
jgi:beta-mannosidase